ncbi:peptidase inhibitor i9 domain-containing protein [Rhizoctonia solani AG-1 IA]|uniref:Peptidase inhibitor i9 domain-containing protein n=1 Tax=Thanatephorus cucumeris (strain AG1-IA) TaxID=983506 RepID=L8WFC8_THACA|nr:peptidase inhibitor i9 domain-containing protein [Rhizoctonia solani AG-1 IA]
MMVPARCMRVSHLIFDESRAGLRPEHLGGRAQTKYKVETAMAILLTALVHISCFLSFALFAAALVAPALAAPAAIPITKLAGPVNENSYIIKLKDGVSKDSHVARLLKYIGNQDSKVVYKNVQYDRVFNGYAGVLKGPILEYIRRSADVEYIQARIFSPR